eukprot:9110832-Pyramimonas_sp.AAC.1
MELWPKMIRTLSLRRSKLSQSVYAYGPLLRSAHNLYAQEGDGPTDILVVHASACSFEVAVVRCKAGSEASKSNRSCDSFRFSLLYTEPRQRSPNNTIMNPDVSRPMCAVQRAKLRWKP